MGKRKDPTATPVAAVPEDSAALTLGLTLGQMLQAADPVDGAAVLGEGAGEAPVLPALEARVVAHCVALNLRRNPMRDSEVVAVLPAGTPVVVDSTMWHSDGVGVWMAVTALGLEGWVDARFLAQGEEG